ncbi:MAG: hypothetical protein NTZ38_02885 [Candidatus Taylorbacteria bacterium]|nr:hypothetical protein [Candidatus Taylorbacteria bacterium]
MKIERLEDIQVWQKARSASVLVYKSFSISKETFDNLFNLYIEISRMLAGFIKSL